MAEYATLCGGGAVFITAVIITIVILKLCFLSAIITQQAEYPIIYFAEMFHV